MEQKKRNKYQLWRNVELGHVCLSLLSTQHQQESKYSNSETKWEGERRQEKSKQLKRSLWVLRKILKLQLESLCRFGDVSEREKANANLEILAGNLGRGEWIRYMRMSQIETQAKVTRDKERSQNKD